MTSSARPRSRRGGYERRRTRLGRFRRGHRLSHDSRCHDDQRQHGHPLVAVNSATFGATPVQDSKSNTWVQVGTAVSIGASPDTETRVYKAVNVTGGSGHTFTVNPASGGFAVLLAVECLNTPASPTVTADRQADASSPYTSPSIAPGTPVTLIGGIITDAPSGTEVDTWGGSFASGDKVEEVGDANTSVTGSIAAVSKAAGTYNSSVTVSGVTVTHTGVWIVAVEENASAAALLETEWFRPRPQENPLNVSVWG
jgi:hypothetical protein